MQIIQLHKIVVALAGVLAIAATSVNAAPSPEPQKSEPNERPNIIVIVADDLAFSDLSAFGSEISTPNLAAIAEGGVTHTHFYTSPMCSPSRAMLLTGVEQHKTGYGTMAEFLDDVQVGQPGYEGYLNNRVATLAERLKDAGYATAMSGKWHLGEQSLPSNRGFDRSFALVEGAGSHFDDSGYADFKETVTYLRDGKAVKLPEDFYSSDFYVSEMIEQIDASIGEGKPFFGYLAFTAPHWPLHAPAESIAKYEDVYAGGWEVLRRQRHEALQRSGVISQDVALPPSHRKVPDWESLSDEEKKYQSKLMSVYAGMVDRLDWNVGRLMSHLESKGIKDNTIIVFTSDNGPEAIDFTTDPIFPPATDWVAANFDNSYEKLGGPESYPFYGRPWAQAGAATHRLYKTFVTQGGTHVPLIISWPAAGIDDGRKTRTFSTMVDVAPTLLEMAGVDSQKTQFDDRTVEPISGLSMLPYLTGKADSIYPPMEGQGFELFGNRAFISGDWKILSLRPPEGDGSWTLHNLIKDPGETTDLSEEKPALMRQMVASYEDYVKKNHVIAPPDEFEMFGDRKGH